MLHYAVVFFIIALIAAVFGFGGIAAGEVSNAAGVAAGAKLLTVAAGVEGFSWLRNDVGGRGQYTDGPVPRSEPLGQRGRAAAAGQG